jgi:hypothetical protein
VICWLPASASVAQTGEEVGTGLSAGRVVFLEVMWHPFCTSIIEAATPLLLNHSEAADKCCLDLAQRSGRSGA